MKHVTAISFLQQSDPILAAVIERVGPCLLTTDEGDLLSCLAETIIYQQLSGKAAATIHRRFRQIYGETVPLTAAAILNTPDDVLRAAGLSRSKVTYIKDLAERIQAGLPTLEELQELDDEAIAKTLTQIRGIGRWSVQMLLIFRLGRLDVLPTDDLGVRAAIQKLYGLEALPDKKTMEELGQRWKPYRSIAVWYLWRSLDTPSTV
ncbi:DNA-3-methyladenine glycosylase 2 family protein [Oscillatoria sp. FACHB-1407]|nr:DNA-3-methyladenine glycosylase 2 family protein [Oscillatoria sp. FACHB-1407]